MKLERAASLWRAELGFQKILTNLKGACAAPGGSWSLPPGRSTDTWEGCSAQGRCQQKGIIWYLCQILTGKVTSNFREASKNKVWWSEKFSHKNTFILLPNEVEPPLSGTVLKDQVRHTSISNRNWRNTNVVLKQRRKIQQPSCFQLLPAVSCISAPNACLGFSLLLL